MSIKKFKEAATILQEVDVSAIITSLALGIAEAQEQLDNNSIKQVLALADPDNGLGGQSLLELGFVPAFYHFQYADVSASISLKMKESSQISFGISASLDYAKTKGYSQENIDSLETSKNETHRREYKSSRSFMMSASEDTVLNVQSQSVQLNTAAGSVKRVEDLSQDIRNIASIDRVRSQVQSNSQAVNAGSSADVQIGNHNGYVTIWLPVAPGDDQGILSIDNYTSTPFDINGGAAGGDFNVATDFDTTLTAAQAAVDSGGSGEAIGFNSDGVHVTPGTAEEVMVRFDHDVDRVDPSVTGNTAALDYLYTLLEILAADDNAKLNLIGHTDRSGKEGYNVGLSKDRANNMKTWLVNMGANPTQVTADGEGEVRANADAQNTDEKFLDHRVVIATLDSDKDYIFFRAGKYDANTITVPGVLTGGNEFIYNLDVSVLVSPYGVVFEYGGQTFNFSANTYADIAAVQTAVDNLYTQFSYEIENNVLYLLHEESTLQYTLYSKDQEEIELQINGSNASGSEGTNDTYVFDETLNAKSYLKRDAEKIEDPSTFAVGATVDFRVARQFEMSVEGNSAMSARLVSLPAPTEFLDKVKSFFN